MRIVILAIMVLLISSCARVDVYHHIDVDQLTSYLQSYCETQLGVSSLTPQVQECTNENLGALLSELSRVGSK